MQPNILFILVDGLRSDQCFGDVRTSNTPYINSLISSGVYFNNAFSSADGTIISLNCLFNSKPQSVTGIRAKKTILLQDNHLETLRNSDYYISGLIPKLTSLNPISDYFENQTPEYDVEPNTETLSNGLTEKISKLIDLLASKSPWFCYLHLYDLHPVKEGKEPSNIENFQYKKFGNSLYEQTVSSIDHWLSKIFSNVNFENTLLILTSDHGERLPFDEKNSSSFEPKLNSITKLGKKFMPKSLQPSSGKLIGKFKQGIGNVKLNYSNKDLTNYQKRSREPYFTLSLYDELLHIPLILKGLDLKTKLISKQVSTLDIFPTIFEILKIPYIKTKYSNSLIPLINDENFIEKPLFLHTIPYEKESSSDKVGIRTNNYKYFRNSRDPKKNVHLYNLITDPYEIKNIAQDNSEIISNMEELLDNFKNISSSSKPILDQKEEQKINEELKKLGYL